MIRAVLDISILQDARMPAPQPPAPEQVGAGPLTATGWSEIAGTQDRSITINNIDITMMTIFSQECASTHLIKLK
jgi:hypothetical protein